MPTSKGIVAKCPRLEVDESAWNNADLQRSIVTLAKGNYFLGGLVRGISQSEWLGWRNLPALASMLRYYIYRSLVYLGITLRYSSPFGLVRSSPVQEQVITISTLIRNGVGKPDVSKDEKRLKVVGTR